MPGRREDAIAVLPSGTTSPGGSDTQVQFNDGGAFGGNSGFLFDKNTGLMTVAANISAGNVLVTDEAYSVSWDSSLQTPTKNALYDKIQTLVPFSGGVGNVSIDGQFYGQVFNTWTPTGGIPFTQYASNGLYYTELPSARTATLLFPSLGGNRIWTLPDATGTIALTSDIPSVTGFVPYTGATSDVNLGSYNLTASQSSFASSNINLFDDEGVATIDVGDTDNPGLLNMRNTSSSVTIYLDGATGLVNLSALTASELVATDGSKNLQSLSVATYPSLTELSYVKGVTSAVQTQINGKMSTGGGTFTGDISVPDEAYGAGWNGSVEVPTKNALYDKNQTIAIAAATTEVDFGSTPVRNASFTITNASVTTSSVIVAGVQYSAPTGKELDELEMDNLVIKCGAGSGTFDMYIESADQSLLADKSKINYIVQG